MADVPTFTLIGKGETYHDESARLDIVNIILVLSKFKLNGKIE